MKKSKYIDHTLLKADATKVEIEKLCQEAIKHDFAAVCVNAYWVEFCYEKLKNTDIKVCSVVGFPLGATTANTKAAETKEAVANGASEIDMVINIGELKNGNYDIVENDIKAVVEAAKPSIVKVIIETCLLSEEEKVIACKLAKNANAAFVKTSTGFSTAGATIADVKLMKETVGDSLEVKAAGGVRTPEDFQNMIDAGATRIGTSGGIALINEQKLTTDY